MKRWISEVSPKCSDYFKVFWSAFMKNLNSLLWGCACKWYLVLPQINLSIPHAHCNQHLPSYFGDRRWGGDFHSANKSAKIFFSKILVSVSLPRSFRWSVKTEKRNFWPTPSLFIDFLCVRFLTLQVSEKFRYFMIVLYGGV